MTPFRLLFVLACLLAPWLAPAWTAPAQADDAEEAKPKERHLQHGATHVYLSAGLTEDQTAPVIVMAGAAKGRAALVRDRLRRAKLRYVVIATGTRGPFPSHIDYDRMVKSWIESSLQWTSLAHRALLKSPWIVHGHGVIGLAALHCGMAETGRYQAAVLSDVEVPAKDVLVLSKAKTLRRESTSTKEKGHNDALIVVVQDLQDAQSPSRWFARSAWHARSTDPSRAVSFPAADGLEIRGDYFPRKSKMAPVVVLFHQARSSRGEYGDIAPRLMHMGYTCLAIDQRSGDRWAGIRNETAARAKKAGTPQGYIDARADLDAAIAWLRSEGHTGKLAIVGSSYSSSLAIFVGADNKEVAAVVSFSPGDYLPPRGSILAAGKRLTKPLLVVCPPREKRQAQQVFDAVASEAKTLYVQPLGVHGASTLNRSPTAAEAWTRFTDFLAASLK